LTGDDFPHLIKKVYAQRMRGKKERMEEGMKIILWILLISGK